MPHPGGVLGLLSELTSCVLGAGGADPLDAGWSSEAADMLLEAWVELLADPCRWVGGAAVLAGVSASFYVSVHKDAGWSSEAAGMLLEAWVALLAGPCSWAVLRVLLG